MTVLYRHFALPNYQMYLYFSSNTYIKWWSICASYDLRRKTTFGVADRESEVISDIFNRVKQGRYRDCVQHTMFFIVTDYFFVNHMTLEMKYTDHVDTILKVEAHDKVVGMITKPHHQISWRLAHGKVLYTSPKYKTIYMY